MKNSDISDKHIVNFVKLSLVYTKFTTNLPPNALIIFIL